MKMKKIILLILILVIVTPTLTFAANDVSFTDLTNHWAKDVIVRLYQKNILGGYPDNTYKPNKAVTVAEFLKLSMASAGIESNYAVSPWYKDVLDDALAMGIIDNKLYNSPNEAVTRKDVAVVLAKLIEKDAELKSQFITGKVLEYDRFKYLVRDAYTLTKSERDSIYKIFEYGMVTGTLVDEKVYFKPESNLTRAEIAPIVERLMDESKLSLKYASYPNKSSIFSDQERMFDLTSYTFRPDGNLKKLLFSYESMGIQYNDLELTKTVNPNIDAQTYELAKVLIDDDHYFDISVIEDSPYNDDRVIVSFSKSDKYLFNGSYFFTYIFEADNGYDAKADSQNSKSNFSNNVAFSLWLRSLWWDGVPDDWCDPFYEDKLRGSVIAIFGEEVGNPIYEYVLNEYKTRRNSGSLGEISKTKIFGNVQVDFYTGDSSILHFFFSYK